MVFIHGGADQAEPINLSSSDAISIADLIRGICENRALHAINELRVLTFRNIIYTQNISANRDRQIEVENTRELLNLAQNLEYYKKVFSCIRKLTL